MPSNLYTNEDVTFICGKNFLYAGTVYVVGDEFDQELSPGRIEQLVRTRNIYPVVNDRAEKTRFFHREVHVREDIERILGKDRGQGQLVLEDAPVQDDVNAAADQTTDVAAVLHNEQSERIWTERTLDEENLDPEDDEPLEGESEPGETEPLPLVHPDEPAESEEEDPVFDEGDLYDPADHNAPEVVDYLNSDISETERNRVLAAERNGKARKGVLGE